jgi:hypothetical protein
MSDDTRQRRGGVVVVEVVVDLEAAASDRLATTVRASFYATTGMVGSSGRSATVPALYR